MASSLRLRDLIKNVRNCKTAADERAVVAKECANIRTEIKNENPDYRHRNVAKILYIHMLGYPSHFGQMETLKLITSGHYADKRVGYLGLMLLLDERQEVLMLATHSIKSDLNHPNQYVMGLALSSIANISSPEIARDVSSDVLKLLASTNPYIRKKAALAGVRILRKVPEVQENFLPRIKPLLSEFQRNHGVLLTGISLMIELCELDEKNIDELRPLTPKLVSVLKNLLMSGYAPDHDVQGITDPFLQSKILQLLRLFGRGNREASEAMNDILAQVATNTETTRNVGNAILYECVQTIMGVESESGLRVLAINILGKFLLNRDNNIRYVALNTLSQLVARDIQAVQRHRNTIVNCLRKDTDVSIRRRALDLIYVLVDKDNVEELVNELVDFLKVADYDLRADLVSKICMVSDRFAPNRKWHIDTIIRVLAMSSGTNVSSEIVGNLISAILTSEESQPYAVAKMWQALKSDLRQPALVQVGVWAIGEYGDLLVEGTESGTRVSESEVIDLLERILKDPLTDTRTKEYVVTALIKLSSRFNSGVERLQALVKPFASSMNIELQQRSCEFSQILAHPNSQELRASLLSPIPAPEETEDDENEEGESKEENGIGISGSGQLLAPLQEEEKKKPAEGNILDQIFGGLSVTTPSTGPSGGVPNGGSTGGNLNQILGQILTPATLGGTGGASPSLIPLGGSGGGSILDTPPVLLPGGGNGFTGGSLPVGPTVFAPVTAFRKNGVVITFDFSKPDPNNRAVTNVIASFVNETATPISNFVFLAAVPRFIKLTIQSPSGNVLPPLSSGKVTQAMTLENTQQGVQPLAVRIRVEYVQNDNKVAEQATINEFPAGL